MSIEHKRLHVDPQTRVESLVREADTTPVEFEMNGRVYEIIAKDKPSSPYTVEGLYGSLPLCGEDGQPLSDDELEKIIDDAREEHARRVVDEMNNGIQ